MVEVQFSLMAMYTLTIVLLKIIPQANLVEQYIVIAMFI